MKILTDHNIKPSDTLHIGAMRTDEITMIVSEDTEYDKIPLVKRI